MARLAGDVGLDADEVASVLGSDAYADEVRADEAQASAMGVRGVPFFLVGRFGVSGAQSPRTLLEALARAASEEASQVVAGPTCGPGGCD